MQYGCRKIVLLLLLAVTPFFFWGGPDAHGSRTLRELWNNGHILFFFLLTLFVYSTHAQSQATRFRRFLSCVIVTVLLGGVIELVQLLLPGRTSSVADLARDISGCMIAFSVVIFKAGNSTIVRLLSIVSGSAVLAVCSFSLVMAVRDEIAAWRDFPLLSGFEEPGELSRWSLNSSEASRDEGRARTGRYSLRVEFSTAEYSGLSLAYFPHDWREYDSLLFSVYNPGEPLALHFRVHDRSHRERQEYNNRYNGNVLLEMGWSDIRISMKDILNGPRGRVMDLADIQGFGIFVMKQQEKGVLYLDDVRLE